MSLLLIPELLRPSPNPVVEGWVAERPAAELYFSAVGEAELRYGVAMLPAGRRTDASASLGGRGGKPRLPPWRHRSGPWSA